MDQACRLCIVRLHVAHDHPDIAIVAEQRTDRDGDIGRVERGGCNLIEQRLEQMIITPVDQRDTQWQLLEPVRGGEPTKARAHDHHMRPTLRYVLVIAIKQYISVKPALNRHIERGKPRTRSEEHTSELQSLMSISHAGFCMKK